MVVRDLPLPSTASLRRLGVQLGGEIHAGEQSRVFTATVGSQPAVVKLTDARLTDRAGLSQRMQLVETLADRSDTVVAPLALGNALVHALGDWLCTATPFIAGTEPDVSDSTDARHMGRTLADLHRTLSAMSYFEIPNVAALDSTGARREPGWQLLHGDFSAKNLRSTPLGLRIFDFDDAGYGPVAFDVANSIYMVLFDATVNRRPERLDAFRSAFLAGYNADAEVVLTDQMIDALIITRVEALRGWLEDLSTAPIGIRTSSPSWLDTLRVFVAERIEHS